MKSKQQTGAKGSFPRVFGSVFRREGIRGLFKGLGITLIRAVPSNAVLFLTYELVMDAWRTHDRQQHQSSHIDSAISSSP